MYRLIAPSGPSTFLTANLIPESLVVYLPGGSEAVTGADYTASYDDELLTLALSGSLAAAVRDQVRASLEGVPGVGFQRPLDPLGFRLHHRVRAPVESCRTRIYWRPCAAPALRTT